MTKPNRSNSNLQKQNRQQVVAARRTEFYAGPLPHPDIVKKYEEILPGATERIFKQAELQTQHRIEMEKKVISADIIKSYLGLVFGFIIGIGGIGAGVFLATLGFNIWGPLLSGTSLAALVGAFIYGTKTRKQERENRINKLVN